MHKRIEAMKLAYADVRRYDADPRTYDVPVAQLLSKEYARKRAALIDPEQGQLRRARRASPSAATPPISPSSTRTATSPVGFESVYDEFGSGVTVEGMGFILQNRGARFTLDPKHPNVLAGGKRPFHTIIPGLHGARRSAHRLRHHGRRESAAGARAVCLEHGRLRHERAGRRWNRRASPRRNSTGCDVSIEVRVPAATLQQLSERGHEIRIRREYTQEMGRGQAILHDSKTETNYAASDPRADGDAIPEPIVK